MRRPVAWGTSNSCNWKYEHRQDVSETVSILFVGDVVGGLGKRTLLALLPSLRDRYSPDFIVVNGENAAGGVGITPKIAREMLAAGVDVITLGNHTYRHREVYSVSGRGGADPAARRTSSRASPDTGHAWSETSPATGSA